MIKCLATGCALIVEAYNPSVYYWGDMHIVNGAYIFTASTHPRINAVILNGIEQLSGDRPIFKVAQHQNFFAHGCIFVLEDGTPNDAFLERSAHYLRKVYGVAFSAQDRVIAPFYAEQAAMDANHDWSGDGIITIDSPLTFEKELSTIRHQPLEATKDWGRHPDVQRSLTGRLSSPEPAIQQLPGTEVLQAQALAAIITTCVQAATPRHSEQVAIPPWDDDGITGAL